MKNQKPPGAVQGRALANIDRALEKLMSRGAPDAELQELREAREILGGAPLDRIEALAEGLSPGSVDDMDFEAVETALWDGLALGGSEHAGASPGRRPLRRGGGAGLRARRGVGLQGPKEKAIATRFGTIAVGRQYCHCATRGSGVAPRDLALGVAGESFSPGLLRVVARFNAEAGARRASDPVFESIRLSIGPSQVGRKARTVGEKIRERELSETEPLDPGAPVCGAVQILDLCHVLKRLSDVAKALAKSWRGMVRSERLQPVVEELKSHATRHEKAGETVACFECNRSKMDHPRYRAAGFPVGSGVIEGACRSVVCERLKISGMFWSIAGANKIPALRRAVESNAFDDFREDWEKKKKAA